MSGNEDIRVGLTYIIFTFNKWAWLDPDWAWLDPDWAWLNCNIVLHACANTLGARKGNLFA